jgi:hypothetical protein
MNINQLLNIGNESAGYEGPKSLLDEMMEEIGFESDIDNAIYEADAAAVTSAASIVENVYAVMAEREAGIEGASVLEAYKGFGLEGALVNYVGQEAITDVVSRRAYSGIAQLKSLINTLIAWVSKILGLSANTKKIFKSLAEKAKKVRKELSKARAALSTKAMKAGDEKELTREIPNYIGEDNLTGTLGLKNVLYVYENVKKSMEFFAAAKSIDEDANITIPGSFTGSLATSTDDFSANKKEEYAEKIKTWKEDTKNEETGDTIFAKVNAALDVLVNAKGNKTDVSASAEKAKKHLEKVRKSLESDKTITADNMNKIHDNINKFIAWVSLDAAYMTMFAKFYVRVADEVFTDAKWLIMKAA